MAVGGGFPSASPRWPRPQGGLPGRRLRRYAVYDDGCRQRVRPAQPPVVPAERLAPAPPPTGG